MDNTNGTKTHTRTYSIPDYCHDIQGTLRSISGLLQIVRMRLPRQMSEEDGELISCIDSAIRNVTVLGDWSRNLLQGEILNRGSRVEVREVVDEVRGLLGVRGSRSLEAIRGCEIRVDPAIPPVRGNYFEILCALQNLVENAVRHARTEALRIEVSLVGLTVTVVRILFSDNGDDMSPEDKERIKLILQGVAVNENLGLSICKSMLTNNEGSIKFIENVKGCAYEISLPVFRGIVQE